MFDLVSATCDIPHKTPLRMPLVNVNASAKPVHDGQGTWTLASCDVNAPRELDNSAGGQVWVTSRRWGPLENQLLHFSFGHCTLNLVLRQAVEGQWQAGAYRFPGIKFLSGSMRGRFSTVDGQLYVCGLDGWQTGAVQDGCLQRVRYTGKPWTQPISLAVEPKAIAIEFAGALDASYCAQPKRFRIEQWQYRWRSEYGSPEYRISDPDVEVHDTLKNRADRNFR